MISIQSLQKDSFESYINKVAVQFAQDFVISGKWPQEGSYELMQRWLSGMLKNGVDTPNHFLYDIVESSSENVVGNVWYCIREVDGMKTTYIVDIRINEMFRRKYFATQTMDLLEKEFSDKQIHEATTVFTIFAHNEPAYALFTGLNYKTTGYQMLKELPCEQYCTFDDIDFVPFAQEKYDSYIEKTIANYAQENINSGRWTHEGALERSRREITAPLKDGLNTPNNYFCEIIDRKSDTSVGMIWYNIKPFQQVKTSFISDIMVYENFRGKGYATKALGLLEKKLSEQDVANIGLHVFKHNEIAFNLYNKVGYKTVCYAVVKKMENI